MARNLTGKKFRSFLLSLYQITQTFFSATDHALKGTKDTKAIRVTKVIKVIKATVIKVIKGLRLNVGGVAWITANIITVLKHPLLFGRRQSALIKNVWRLMCPEIHLSRSAPVMVTGRVRRVVLSAISGVIPLTRPETWPRAC
jgi:hypothetical protein